MVCTKRHPLVSVLILGGLLLSSFDAVSTAPPRDDNQSAARSIAESDKSARAGYANVGGTRIAYRVYGDLNSGRTPLLILHGSLMSGEAMEPLITRFTAKRPVITVDARGHGATGDVRGPITYPQLADDAAGVLDALNVRRADVLGYSMGGTAALLMAVRHPTRVGKQVVLSAPAWHGGWQPPVLASFAQWTPAMFAGSPVEQAYKRLSSTPAAFPAVINKLREMETSNYDIPPSALRGIRGNTMIVVGDSDGIELEHALALFEARGGADPTAATKGFISQVPHTRLAILPAVSHVGIMNEGDLIERLVTPFLDDRLPPPPSGFFAGMDRPPSKAGTRE